MQQLRALGFALGALCAATALPAAGQTDTAYLEQLQAEARQMALSADPHWHNLLHYQPDLLGGVTSLADAPAFFNADDGKEDPEEELQATLAAFFSDKPPGKDSQHPQCAFIGRYRWLKEKLDFDPARLPEQPCPRFDAWVKAIDPAQVTLVFPTAHMNSPSSMFGHSLIRIDQPNQTERTRLFSYAINFAAETDESNGLLFAVLGLAGGYPGYFSIMPYYEKVKQYNHMENRDVWEYQLNLSDEEIRRLLEHAWELGPVNFDYFFLGENCSYQLLALLDVARPGREWAERFPFWAIPADTVREVLTEEGIMKKAVYRPSLHTRIDHRRSRTDEADQRLALDLVDGRIASGDVAELPERRRANVLELAYDYLQYRFNSGEFERDTMASRSIDLLRARSLLPAEAGEIEPVPVPPVRPEQGHDTARLAVQAGQYDGRDYAQLRLRPAFHDLLDPEGGYLPGGQIDFFDITARYYPDEDNLRLHEFRVLDIVSISPRDAFFRPMSWRVKAGAFRMPLLGYDDPELFPAVDAGYGPSYRLAPDLTITAMAEGALALHKDLPEDYTAGAGPSLTLLWKPAEPVKLLFGSRALRYAGRLNENFVTNRLEAGVGIGHSLSVRAGVEETRGAGDSATDGYIGLHWYF